MAVDLLAPALAGDAVAQAALVSVVAEIHATKGDGLDEILDVVALASVSNEIARHFLLRLVFQARLARPAIAQVIIEPNQIDDVEQNVLIAVEHGIVGFQGRSKFRSWLYRVSRNEALMYLRRARRTQQAADADNQPLPLTGGRLSSMVVTRTAIEVAIANLPERYRSVIVLRAVEGKSYAEIAAQLQIELNTVRSRLHKARSLLQDALLTEIETR